MINGLDSIAITKLDILDDLDEIKICTAYIDKHTKDPVLGFPEDLSSVEPFYETLPGWKSSTKGITIYNDLPKEAKDFLDKISFLTKTPISMIGTGPGREEIIILKEYF